MPYLKQRLAMLPLPHSLNMVYKKGGTRTYEQEWHNGRLTR